MTPKRAAHRQKQRQWRKDNPDKYQQFKRSLRRQAELRRGVVE
jgi:hypothetical protein